MLKKTIVRFGLIIGFSLSFLFSKKFFAFLRLLKNSIYSGWLSVSLKKVGENFFVHYPINCIGLNHISIGKDFTCFARLRIEAIEKHLTNSYNPIINIGDNVNINFDCHIACVNLVEIGNNVLIASKVFITDHFHGEIDHYSLNLPPSERKVVSKGAVKIHDNVWIGEGVCILPNVTIGENSIIGANAVVTKSFPNNSVIGGNPAKLIKII